MRRHTYTFPYNSATRVANGLNRLMERWQRGGIEEYELGPVLHGGRKGEPRLLRTWGFENGIEVTEHPIRLHPLPEAFHGLRIVHLTDIHHGLYLPLQALVDAVELANRLEPDVVVLTGDYVTYSRAYIEPMAEILGTLRPTLGAFAVLGNHDFRVGADPITRALRRRHIHVLRNQHAALRRGHQALHLAGIDDLGYGADLARALRGIPPHGPTILLSHNPAIIRRAARHGVALILSGHTHGGQVKLPLVGSIYGRPPERMRFKSGLDSYGHTQIYVSRGIGTVVLPLRFRCPAEIPLFQLLPEHHHRAENVATFPPPHARR